MYEWRTRVSRGEVPLRCVGTFKNHRTPETNETFNQCDLEQGFKIKHYVMLRNKPNGKLSYVHTT